MNIVEYVIKFKDQGLAKGLKNADKQAEKLDKTIGKTNKTLGAGTVIAAAAAAAAIGAFVSSSLKAFDAQAKAEAQVAQGLKTTQNAAGRTFQELTKQASALQNNTLFGDEDILKNVTAQLLTFTNISGKQFDRTQQAALDLATRLDGDLKSSAIQLGKALNDPVKNLSALSRSGIQFSKAQIDVIKKLQETNKLGEAQAIILTELEKQYGGSAAAAAAVGTGALTQLSNRLGDIKETIGAALMPIINVFAAAITRIASFIENSNAGFTIFIQTLGTLVAIVVTLVAVMRIWSAVQLVLNVLLTANPIGLIIVAVALLIAGIIKLYKSSETFRGIISGIFAVLKSVWSFIKALLLPIFNKVKESFKGTGGSIMDFLKKPIDLAIESFNNFLDLLEKIPGVGKLVKNLRESFSKGFKEGVKEFRKEQEKVKLDPTTGSPFSPGTGAGLTPTTPTAKKTSTSAVRSAAPKQFNINIENLVKELQVVTTNLTEGAEEVKDKLTAALLEAVADVEISRQ
jgi:hypothetical protein